MNCFGALCYRNVYRDAAAQSKTLKHFVGIYAAHNDLRCDLKRSTYMPQAASRSVFDLIFFLCFFWARSRVVTFNLCVRASSFPPAGHESCFYADFQAAEDRNLSAMARKQVCTGGCKRRKRHRMSCQRSCQL